MKFFIMGESTFHRQLLQCQADPWIMPDQEVHQKQPGQEVIRSSQARKCIRSSQTGQFNGPSQVKQVYGCCQARKFLRSSQAKQFAGRIYDDQTHESWKMPHSLNETSRELPLANTLSINTTRKRKRETYLNHYRRNHLEIERQRVNGLKKQNYF